MKVIVPITFDKFTDLVVSGLVYRENPIWNPTTNYVVGNRVSVGNESYEALVNNVNINPLVVSEIPTWVRLGFINGLKAFDETIYDQSVGNGSDTAITYRIKAPTSMTSVAFFNVEAQSIEVVVRDEDDTVDVFTETIDMVDGEGIENWSDYFFEPASSKSDALVDGFLAYPGMILIIRIINTLPSVPKIGQIVVGKSNHIGVLCEGTQIGIVDYSRKERDEWGNPTIVERPFSHRSDYDIVVPTSSAKSLRDIFSSIRAKPAVFYDEDDVYNATTVYGYYQDFSVTLQVGETSHMNLEVEGLV